MSEPTPLAGCFHDFAGGAQLTSYTPVPSEELRQGEALAIKTYGFPVSSPVTPFKSVWRSESSPRMNAETAPKRVFFTAMFGETDWRPPADLVTQAMDMQRMATLVLRANWNMEREPPYLDRFEVEITAKGGEQRFRSMNFDEHVDALDITWGSLQLPRNGAENLAFNGRVILPERFNKGNDAGDQRVELTLSGVAVPIPPWVNY